MLLEPPHRLRRHLLSLLPLLLPRHPHGSHQQVPSLHPQARQQWLSGASSLANKRLVSMSESPGYAGRYIIHFGVREHAMLAILPLGKQHARAQEAIMSSYLFSFLSCLKDGGKYDIFLKA